MKITHVYHHYEPVLGGMEKVVRSLAETQAKMGHKPNVLTSKCGAEEEPRREVLNGVSVNRLESFRIHFPDLTCPTESPEEILRESDIVHVHSQNSLFNLLLAKKAKETGTPVLLEVLALNYLEHHENPAVRLFGSTYQRMVQNKAVDLSNGVIALNSRDRRVLMEECEIESKVVPHGVDNPFLDEPPAEEIFRNSYEVWEDKIIAFVGRLSRRKGPDVLVKAIPRLSRVLDGFKVVIAGKGSSSYLEKLKNLAQRLGVGDLVDFPGYISEREKISLLDAAEVLAFPTRHVGEAYPLVIDEAYSRKTPVIGTRVGGLPSRIREGETGFVIPPEDPQSLADSLEEFLRGNPISTEFIEEAREAVLTWEQVAERVEGVYRNLAK